MVPKERLKDLLHKPGLTRKQQILLCVAVDVDRPKAVAEVRELAVAGGLRAAGSWNISSILTSAPGKIVRTNGGWELTAQGKTEVRSLLGLSSPAHVGALTLLRAHLAQLKPGQVQSFLEEAIGCAEHSYHRAAVVLSWVGTTAVLYDHVISHHLSAFNAEARRRDPKWRDAKTSDDLAKLKEFDFLQILEAISVIGKSVKTELEGCLKLRNGCGHPNSLLLSESRVAAHLETLILNVFSQFT
jgi:hypothetical protein